MSEADKILQAALYEAGYCERTSDGRLKPPNGHAPGCGGEGGCDGCWVSRAWKYLDVPVRADDGKCHFYGFTCEHREGHGGPCKPLSGNTEVTLGLLAADRRRLLVVPAGWLQYATGRLSICPACHREVGPWDLADHGNWWDDCEFAAALEKGAPSDKEYCDRCDGCGWYEGGPTLQTKCEDCNGTGTVEAK